MKAHGLIVAAFAVAITGAPITPVEADVIIPGPPLVKIKLSAANRSARIAAAKQAALDVTNLSGADRPEFLNKAYRSASVAGLIAVEKVERVTLVGDRAYILAVSTAYLAPQTIGEVYTYIQCTFDDDDRVVGLEILNG